MRFNKWCHPVFLLLLLSFLGSGHGGGAPLPPGAFIITTTKSSCPLSRGGTAIRQLSYHGIKEEGDGLVKGYTTSMKNGALLASSSGSQGDSSSSSTTDSSSNTNVAGEGSEGTGARAGTTRNEKEVATAKRARRSMPPPYALCFPPNTRTAGCQELIFSPQNSSPIPRSLPCVTNGHCPFVRFTCSRGHTWKAEPGSPVCFYCPTCKTKEPRASIQGKRRPARMDPDYYYKRLGEVAEERGGKLLSTSYLGSRAKHAFACREGHEWAASATNILNGCWCPKCSPIAEGRRRTMTIKDMQEMAAFFGGQCLSSEYQGSQGKLTWRCSKGHVFEKVPNNIRRRGPTAGRGVFCSRCYMEERGKIPTTKTTPLKLWKDAPNLPRD